MPGAGIDPSSLVVVEGKVWWDLCIDGLVVSSDGNLLDALAAAIKVFLSFEIVFLSFSWLGCDQGLNFQLTASTEKQFESVFSTYFV